jgi:hypothetical protein
MSSAKRDFDNTRIHNLTESSVKREALTLVYLRHCLELQALQGEHGGIIVTDHKNVVNGHTVILCRRLNASQSQRFMFLGHA